jgi:hypothetical protein
MGLFLYLDIDMGLGYSTSRKRPTAKKIQFKAVVSSLSYFAVGSVDSAVFFIRGKARRGVARRGKAWPGAARQG